MKNTHTPKAMVAALALAGMALLTLSGCEKANGKAAEAPAAGAPITAATVIEREVAETQEFSGRLEAVDKVEIRPRVGGFITAINFKPGALVRKGDVLFVIDPRPYQAELSRAEAAAGAARARADLAKLELQRAEKLVAEKAIAQRELDEKASALRELDANARAAQASFEAARLNLEFTKVHAPIGGRVSKAEATVGNLVDATNILTSVVSSDPIYASFDGDEETYLRVARQARQGGQVVVKVGLANETGHPHVGKLEFVDNQLDPKTGSVKMRATFANPDQVLSPGLFARVQLGGGSAVVKSAMINERAVGTDQDRKFVYVVNAASKAEYRPVTLGPSVDGLRMVRSGLAAGEKIIVNGLQRVHPGAPVTAAMVAMDADPDAPAPAKKDDAKVAALATGGKE